MTAKGRLTVVLGGKSFGKSFVRSKAIEEIGKLPNSNCVVVAVNMRDTDVADLLPTVDKKLSELVRTAETGGLIDVFEGGLALYLAAEQRAGPAAMAASLSLRNFIGMFSDKSRGGRDALIAALSSCNKLPAIVIDEANRGLPGEGGEVAVGMVLASGCPWQAEKSGVSDKGFCRLVLYWASESQGCSSGLDPEALAWFVKLTKESHHANVILISAPLPWQA